MAEVTAARQLLPCPFCGSEAKLGGDEDYAVWCTSKNCGVLPVSEEFESQEDAIAAWNRRVPPKASGVLVRFARLDHVGWICSDCHGWNEEKDALCVHGHKPRTAGVADPAPPLGTEASALPGWQPIETAPKGGKWVLLWWPHVTDAPFVGYLVHDTWHAATDGTTWSGSGPTHWQPLPAPPDADPAPLRGGEPSDVDHLMRALVQQECVLNECEALLKQMLDDDGVDVGFDERLAAYWISSKALGDWRSRDMALSAEPPRGGEPDTGEVQPNSDLGDELNLAKRLNAAPDQQDHVCDADCLQALGEIAGFDSCQHEWSKGRVCLNCGRHERAALEPFAALDAAFVDAIQSAQVPNEALEVYTSNSYRRVGLKREYRVVLEGCVHRDGQSDIRNTDLLVAMVAAFNAMMARQQVTKRDIPACQHDLQKPATTIKVITSEDWGVQTALCNACGGSWTHPVLPPETT